MRKLPFFAVILCVTLISGCAKKNWWVGTWKLDLDHTEKRLTDDPAIKPQMAEMFKQMLTRQGEWQVTITPTDLIWDTTPSAPTSPQASPAAPIPPAASTPPPKKPYTISGTPTDNTVVLQGDGKLTTCTLEGEYLVTKLAESKPLKLYFKRVK